MSELPSEITSSKLWGRLIQYSDFHPAIKGIRDTSAAIAAKIAEVLPDYTDHSVIHMDALWGVTGQVFTDEEIQSFSPGEAFILASSFYVHDIGMALAATPQGRTQLEQSSAFLSAYERALHSKRFSDEEAKVLALKEAARETHAERAETFIDSPLPGLDRYLLESTELRGQWGAHIGLVSASHHWSLQEVNRRLGIRGRVPDSIGGDVDLGFAACALRIIDYAHINAARASSLERILRSKIAADSLKHWRAQERIAGPLREGDHLVFGSTRPLDDVDGWWTFYEMASGLDNEITSVKDYLSNRTASSNRFSLEGVKGIKTPQNFSTYVLTDGFEPVDIRFRPTSMERLVELLGGKTLYGDDFFAPIRELLQNARDAITLQKAFAENNDFTTELGEIRVTVETTDEGGAISFIDNGVGMSERVITNYLLGIASDYWHSPEFFSDYPEVSKVGFKPAGRFGIGFLSVFMVGDEVEVQSQRRGGSNLSLHLRGVGQRGSLITRPAGLRAGTTVRVKVDRESLGDYNTLDKVIRAKAPMLDIPVRINQHGTTSVIEPHWWKHCDQEEFIEFISTQSDYSSKPARKIDRSSYSSPYSFISTSYQIERGGTWYGEHPEILTESYRILATPWSSDVLLCSKGFVVTRPKNWVGISGVIEIGDVNLNAARSQALQWDEGQCLKEVREKLRPSIQAGLSNLSKDLSIPSKCGLLVDVAEIYGVNYLLETDLTWVSILTPPGRSDLISPYALIELIRERQEVIIVYGEYANPWDSMNMSKVCFPEMSGSAVIVQVSSNNQTTPERRFSRDEIEWGAAQTHFERDKQYGYMRSDRGYDGAALLKVTLSLVGTALGVSEQDLAKRDWAHVGETICLRVISA